MKKNKKDNSKTINIIITIGIILLIGLLVYLFINSGTDNRIKKISYNEYQKVLKKEGYSIILLTNPTCVHCNNYKPFVNYVAIENNLDVYDIDLTTLSYEEYTELHDEYTATKNDYNEDTPVIRTPATIIVKNGGEVTSILGDIGYDTLVKLLKTNKVIE